MDDLKDGIEDTVIRETGRASSGVLRYAMCKLLLIQYRQNNKMEISILILSVSYLAEASGARPIQVEYSLTTANRTTRYTDASLQGQKWTPADWQLI